MLLLVAFGGGCSDGSITEPALPPLTLWAWERPERLGFIDPRQTGVALLAGTLRLRGATVEVRPRLQLAELPPGSRPIAVVRIEAGGAAEFGEPQRQAVVDAVLRLADLPGVTGVQIDFDVARSQRDFYRRLLADLRGRLPDGQGLSMTALASWCLHDRWLAGLPVDYAVPMLFRMGGGTTEARRVLAREGEFPEPLCRLAVGVMEDEPWPPLRRPRPVFAFRARPWDAEAVNQLQQESHRWSSPDSP